MLRRQRAHAAAAAAPRAAAAAAAREPRRVRLLPARVPISRGCLPWLLWVGWCLLPAGSGERAGPLAVGVWVWDAGLREQALLHGGRSLAARATPVAAPTAAHAAVPSIVSTAARASLAAADAVRPTHAAASAAAQSTAAAAPSAATPTALAAAAVAALALSPASIAPTSDGATSLAVAAKPGDAAAAHTASTPVAAAAAPSAAAAPPAAVASTVAVAIAPAITAIAIAVAAAVAAAAAIAADDAPPAQASAQPPPPPTTPAPRPLLEPAAVVGRRFRSAAPPVASPSSPPVALSPARVTRATRAVVLVVALAAGLGCGVARPPMAMAHARRATRAAAAPVAPIASEPARRLLRLGCAERGVARDRARATPEHWRGGGCGSARALLGRDCHPHCARPLHRAQGRADSAALPLAARLRRYRPNRPPSGRLDG